MFDESHESALTGAAPNVNTHQALSAEDRAIDEDMQASRRAYDEELLDILKEEQEIEAGRAEVYKKETSKLVRRRLRKRFAREREEAKLRIERIANEHKAALAAKLVQHNLLR